MSNAERQKRYRAKRNGVTPSVTEPVTEDRNVTPAVTESVTGAATIIARQNGELVEAWTEIARLKKLLAVANETQVTRVSPRVTVTEHTRNDGATCAGVGKCGKLGCRH